MSGDAALVAQTATALFADRGGVARARRLRDDGAAGTSLWPAMAELGWLGATIPTGLGGAGLGVETVMPLFEAAGAALAPEPLVGQLLGAHVLIGAGTGEQQREWLPAIATGEALVAVGGVNDLRAHRVPRDDVTVSVTPEGIVVNGRADLVLDGATAHAVIVVSSGALPAAALVPLGTRGVDVAPQHVIDVRPWARMSFTNVRLPTSAVVIEPGGPFDGLARALDVATVAVCAESLGAMWAAFDRTVAYVKARVQFDRPIGSFQAVQHRLARLYADLLVTEAAVRGGAAATDGDPTQLAAMASMAKVRTASTSRLVAREAIQLHGGVGVTDECDIGLFVKRLRVAEVLFGDEQWHLDRWASCHGY